MVVVNEPVARRRFRFGRSLLHAFVLYLVLATLSGGMGAVTGLDPELTADMVAWLLFPSMLVGVFASFLTQRVWLPLGLSVAGLWAVSLPLFMLWGWNQRRVQGDERVPLEVRGESIVHPTLGFSFPHPGPGFLPIDMSETMESMARPEGHSWLFVNDSSGHVVMASVASSGSAIDSVYIASFARGMKRSMEQGGLEVARESFTMGTEPHYELQTPFWVDPGLIMACKANGPRAKRGVLICVSAFGSNVVQFTGVLDGLTMSPP